MNAVKNFKEIVHEIANFYASALSRDNFTADELVDAIRIFHAAVWGSNRPSKIPLSCLWHQ